MLKIPARFIPSFLKGFPSKRWLNEATAEVKRTPDLPKLEGRPWNYLFEYGELMSGMPKNFFVFGKIQPITNAYTIEKFSLWRYNNGIETYPIALRMPFEDPVLALQAIKAKIRGQIFKVTTADMIALDTYRGIGVKFIRRRVNLVLEAVNPDGNPIRVSAWMYMGHPDYWKKPINFDAQYHFALANSKRQYVGSEFGIVKHYENVRPFIGLYNHFTPFEFSDNADTEIFQFLASRRK